MEPNSLAAAARLLAFCTPITQVSHRLPPAARVLDLALQQPDSSQRLQVLRTALLEGGQGEVPSVGFDALLASAGQLIDDMEEQQVVADRRLLARLCLVREEVGMLQAGSSVMGDAAEAGEAGEGGVGSVAAQQPPLRANVPEQCAALMKELVRVTDGSRRQALLKKAMLEDWFGAAVRPSDAGEASSSGSSRAVDADNVVRPGRWLSTLDASLQHLRMQDNNGPLLQRLSQLKDETLAVLDAEQGKLVAPAAKATSGGSGASAAE